MVLCILYHFFILGIYNSFTSLTFTSTLSFLATSIKSSRVTPQLTSDRGAAFLASVDLRWHQDRLLPLSSLFRFRNPYLPHLFGLSQPYSAKEYSLRSIKITSVSRCFHGLWRSCNLSRPPLPHPVHLSHPFVPSRHLTILTTRC